MSVRPATNHHMHAVNWHTGQPRFHFDATSDAAAAAAAAAAASAAKPWHDGVPDDVKGFWQNKGLSLDNPKDFGLKLTDLYKGAEKFIGVPADQVVKLPKADAPPEDLRAFYERLGAPKEAKDYDLSAVKDTAVADAIRNAAHARGLTKDAAADVAKSVAAALESKTSTDNAVTTAKLAEQKANLQKNWGDKYAYNNLQAIEGARRLGISPDAVKALEGQIGFDQVMEAMRKIGANTREDTFVERGAGGPQGDVTTLEGAGSRKAELMADGAWVDRYLKGGVAEKREMDRLNQMISGYVA
jgi:hypothetical protein